MIVVNEGKETTLYFEAQIIDSSHSWMGLAWSNSCELAFPWYYCDLAAQPSISTPNVIQKGNSGGVIGVIFAGMKLHVGNKHTGEEYVKRKAACPHCSKVFIRIIAIMPFGWQHLLSIFYYTCYDVNCPLQPVHKGFDQSLLPSWPALVARIIATNRPWQAEC